jgi:ribosomal protein L35
MAKLKTHKSTQKRFKITKNGILIHDEKGWRHKNAKRNARVKYRKNGSSALPAVYEKMAKRALPGVSSK